MEKPTPFDRKSGTPFFLAALSWLLLCSGLCVAIYRGTGHGAMALAWLALVWGVCVLDLVALARVVSALLIYASGSADAAPEKKAALGVQTSVWGILKLVCLGTLGAIVFVGRDIPSVSLLAGLGTLVIVPLAGGFWWSQKVLSHA